MVQEIILVVFITSFVEMKGVFCITSATECRAFSKVLDFGKKTFAQETA